MASVQTQVINAGLMDRQVHCNITTHVITKNNYGCKIVSLNVLHRLTGKNFNSKMLHIRIAAVPGKIEQMHIKIMLQLLSRRFQLFLAADGTV